MSRTQTFAYPWGDYDVEPEDDYEPEPEDYCRARSGLCHIDGTCDKCGAIEGEHCKESAEGSR